MSNFKIDFNTKKITKNINKIAVEEINKMSFEQPCPHCNSLIMVKFGVNTCQFCANTVDATFDINLD